MPTMLCPAALSRLCVFVFYRERALSDLLVVLAHIRADVSESAHKVCIAFRWCANTCARARAKSTGTHRAP